MCVSVGGVSWRLPGTRGVPHLPAQTFTLPPLTPYPRRQHLFFHALNRL